MTRDEAEALAPRVRAALAEVGHTNPLLVEVRESLLHPGLWNPAIAHVVPMAVQWSAWLVAGVTPMSCWHCFELKKAALLPLGDRPGCDHDPWMSERPRLERVR